jgi:hypothetical protein
MPTERIQLCLRENSRQIPSLGGDCGARRHALMFYGQRMTRIPGDPGPWRWLLFAIGLRLPPENREWVRHELTDAGWRTRAAVRQLVLVVPVAVAFAALPGPWSLKVTLMALVLVGGLLISLMYADSVRASRLRQHDLPVPDDRDLGRPTDSL